MPSDSTDARRKQDRRCNFNVKNLGVSLTDTIKQIAEMFHLSESESNETVKQYW